MKFKDLGKMLDLRVYNEPCYLRMIQKARKIQEKAFAGICQDSMDKKDPGKSYHTSLFECIPIVFHATISEYYDCADFITATDAVTMCGFSTHASVIHIEKGNSTENCLEGARFSILYIAN